MIDQKMLNEIALWPTEEEASRMLKAVGAGKTPGLPALLSILQWAIEDSGEEIGKAGQVLDELITIASLDGKPKAALRILLDLENPETENLPAMVAARTPTEIAQVMIQLANEAVAK